MFPRSRIAPSFLFHQSAALPKVGMSLEPLWSRHSKSLGQSSANTQCREATVVARQNVEKSLPVREKRKRSAETDVSTQQSKLHKKSPTSFPVGSTDLGSGCMIVFQPRAFKQSDSQQTYKILKDEVHWRHKEVVIYGKKVMQPRQVAYMAGDTSLSYTYSHTKMQPDDWHPQVAQIKAKLQEIAGVEFNSCLLNLYRDGSDHMGWHSDNEKLYGDDPTIGSVSFGATRRFLLRQNSDHSNKWACELASGDVLVMKGSTQQHWTHSIPKMLRVSQPRINLTFRQIVHPEG